MLQRNVNTGTMTHEHDAHAEYRLSQFQTCPSPSPPLPPVVRHLSGICHILGPGGGEFVRKPLPVGGGYVNSFRSG